MSREHHKSMQRGIKQPLGDVEQPARASRHGKPRTRQGWRPVVVIVSAGTPGAVRSVEAGEDGELVVVHRLTVRVPTQEPLTGALVRKVPRGSTAKYGQPNSADKMAPTGAKKKAKP